MAAKRPPNRQATTSVRIIGGEYRGRRLPVVLADGLRPTGDRVRETVFNWLAPYLSGARCVDVCAGTGAMGFEALSRGAGEVTFIELNREAAGQLRTNQQLLGAKATILHGDARQHLQTQAHDQFDIAFLDPPFDALLWDQLITLLIPTMKLGGLVYIEYPKTTELKLPSSWHQIKFKSAGQVNYSLWQYQ